MSEPLYTQCYQCGAVVEYKGDGYRCSCGGGINLMAKKPMDPVNHPQHYKTKTMECKEVIAVMTEGLTGADAYYMGNVLKYLYRYADKNGTEDLDKAITYIGFLKGE